MLYNRLIQITVLGIIGFYSGRLCARNAQFLSTNLIEFSPVAAPIQLLASTPKIWGQRASEWCFACLFAFLGALYPLSVALCFFLLLSYIAASCFITDLRYRILPDQFTLLLLWTGLLQSVLHISVGPEEAILASIAGYSLSWISNRLYVLCRGVEGMYPGDFKLNAAIGAWLGLHLLLPALLLSFFLLLFFVFVQFFFQRQENTLRQEMPYGCFATIALWMVYVIKFLPTNF